MLDIAIGARIVHADHGLGTVGWVGKDYVGVAFDGQGKVLLRRDTTELRLAAAEDEALPADALEQDVSDSDVPRPSEPFFLMEDEEERHFMGSHWDPFFDDLRPVLEQLPAILQRGRVHVGYSRFYPPPARAAVAWSKGFVLQISSQALADLPGFARKLSHPWDVVTSWLAPGGAFETTPDSAMSMSECSTGIAAVLCVAQSGERHNEMRSLFPYCNYGIEHGLIMRRVRVWENGVEAQIEASIGEASLTFFDVDFVNNRDWYRYGLTAQFVLAGLAYDAHVAEPQSFTIPRTQEWFDGMQWLSGENHAPDSGKLEETFSTEGMAMLLPVEGWDRDDYSFRGPVKEVYGMSILGLRAWRMRITVMRFSNHDSEDVMLDIVVTERAWSGDAPPQVGQDVEGHLWLQGRLWLATR